MGICNSVTPVSRKREDISYSDMGCKHSKTAEALGFCFYMKYCRNVIQSNEEQNPLAVMKWPENDLFLLEQLKNWIENKLPGCNALKIISSLRQESIYRSPGVGQQMVVTRYSIWIHIENRDAFYQDASRSQMLLCDAHAPPKRVTSGGDWYIVSMEVFVDKIDFGRRRLDNRNPEVHVKVTLHVANGRMAWPPPDFSPCNVHHQRETYMYNNDLKLKYLDDVGNIFSEPSEYYSGIIYEDCQDINNQPSSTYNSALNENLSEDKGSTDPPVSKDNKNHQDPNERDKFSPAINGRSALYENLSEDKGSTDPPVSKDDKNHQDRYERGLSNKFSPAINGRSALNENLQEDKGSTEPPVSKDNISHQDRYERGRSNKFSPAINGRSGSTSNFGVWVSVLLISTMPLHANASTLPIQCHQVKLEIVCNSNSHTNLTLQTGNGHCLYYINCNQDAAQSQLFNSSFAKNALTRFCEQQRKDMNTNLKSLIRRHNHSSGTLQLNLIWKLTRDFNATNVTIQYIFNGEDLTEEEMTNLPMPISDPRMDHRELSSSEFRKKMEDYAKKLWGSFREELLYFLEKDDLPETTTSPTTENITTNAETTTSPTTENITSNAAVIASSCIVIVIAIVIAIALCIKYGKMSCKKVQEVISKETYRLVTQTAQAQGDPDGMEAPKREDQMTNSV